MKQFINPEAITKMRQFIFGLCLTVSVYTFHVKFSESDVIIDQVEYVETTNKYHLGNLTDENLNDFSKKLQLASTTKVIVNDYADKMFLNFRNLLIRDGYDPIEMPEVHERFSYNLIINYHGELAMTSGWLSDLASLHRGGDVVVSYSPKLKYLVLTLPIGFTNLQFTYDYTAQIMELGPSGRVDGKVTSLVAEVKLGFEVESLKLSVLDFYITRAGNMDFSFRGDPLVDWLLDLLAFVVKEPLKEVVVLIAEGVVRGVFESKINDINSAINGILNPTAIAQNPNISALFAD